MAAKRKRVIATVVGARPQFIKLGPVSRAMCQYEYKWGSAFNNYLIHTGQHFDDDMSASFFRQLKLPKPNVNLDINQGNHGEMTARMLVELEQIFLKIKPLGVVVYGDTNSTLAGALAAAKLHIPVAHVEAGLRSFNMDMPEEINRRLTDHVSSLLFCPTRRAVEQLKKEQIARGVFFTGDVMYDQALSLGKPSESLKKKLQLPDDFVLVTIHRQENTDDTGRLKEIVEGLVKLSARSNVLFPMHPRTRNALKNAELFEPLSSRISIREPFDFIAMQTALNLASTVLTDSGGVQKEAYFAKTPCVTIRTETEWPETLEDGANRLCKANASDIAKKANEAMGAKVNPRRAFGNGKASYNIVAKLDKYWRAK